MDKKTDIIDKVENSLKNAMKAEQKFQAKNAGTGIAFKPNYKPVHYVAQAAQAEEIAILNEDIIVEMLVVYFRHDYFPENFRRIAWELSAKISNVILAYNRHREYITSK